MELRARTEQDDLRVGRVGLDRLEQVEGGHDVSVEIVPPPAHGFLRPDERPEMVDDFRVRRNVVHDPLVVLSANDFISLGFEMVGQIPADEPLRAGEVTLHSATLTGPDPSMTSMSQSTHAEKLNFGWSARYFLMDLSTSAST